MHVPGQWERSRFGEAAGQVLWSDPRGLSKVWSKDALHKVAMTAVAARCYTLARQEGSEKVATHKAAVRKWQ